VYKCHESHYKQKAGFGKFCFQCSTWVESKEEWTHHCQTHIDKDDIPFRCDLVVFRHAVACAGYCPVHLGRQDMPAHKRMKQFTDKTCWQRHVSACLARYFASRGPGNFACPHGLCPVSCNSANELWRHLDDVHSIPKPKAFTLEGQNNELKPECTKGEQKLKFKEHRGSMTGSLQALTLPSREPSALSTADLVVLDSNMPATAVSSTPCNGHRDDESGWSASPSESDSSISDNEQSSDQYPIECLLAMWKTQGTELFLVKWEGGSTSWEPESNVPDQSIAELKRTYRGFRDGIEILHTQVRGKALWYKILFLNFDGADEDRSWWVPEKAMDPEVRVKRETKNKRGRRKHS